MRNISKLAVSLILFATQAGSPISGILAATASSSDGSRSNYEVKLNTNTASAVEIVAPQKPDFETDVLVPLRAAQAETAKKAAEVAAKRKLRTVRTVVKTAKAPATLENMLKLRLCEAGNSYTRNSGNGYYGTYQFNIGTWNNFGGYARPDLAPAEVQDEKFQATYATRGWSPWPACARKLGLM